MSHFSSIRAICFLKKYAAIENQIQKIGCKPILCDNIGQLLSLIDVKNLITGLEI